MMHFGKRKEKREHAQQPPSLHTRLDTPNSWKEMKKKNQPIFFLHEKSDKANSMKKEKMPGSFLSWKISHT